MKNANVLVVDDDETILFAFNEVLKKEGFISIAAKDGKEALEKFASYQPVIIILDITMRNKAGLDILKQIREIDDETPVILITEQEVPQTDIPSQKLGAMDFLVKPLSIARLRESISKVFPRA